jgi:hypothetical protein
LNPIKIINKKTAGSRITTPVFEGANEKKAKEDLARGSTKRGTNEGSSSDFLDGNLF